MYFTMPVYDDARVGFTFGRRRIEQLGIAR
jgi:hypothetical protein